MAGLAQAHAARDGPRRRAAPAATSRRRRTGAAAGAGATGAGAAAASGGAGAAAGGGTTAGGATGGAAGTAPQAVRRRTPAPGGKSQADTQHAPAVRERRRVRAAQPELQGVASRSRTPISPSSCASSAAHRQALHLRRQGPQHQGDGLLAAEGHRRRGVPGVPLDPRDERPHRRAARPLPQDRRDRRRSRRRRRRSYGTRQSRARRGPLRHAPAIGSQHVAADEVGERARQVQVEGRRHHRLRAGQPAHHHRHRREHPPHDADRRGDRRRLARATRCGSSRSTTRPRPTSRSASTSSSTSRAAAAAAAKRRDKARPAPCGAPAAASPRRRRSSPTTARTRSSSSRPSARTCASSSSSSASTSRRPARARSTSSPLQHADAVELTKTLTEHRRRARAPPARRARRAGAGARQLRRDAGIFEGGVKITADKATNSLVVTSSLRDYASLRAVVDRLDQPRRQVFIEAVIMDLSVKRVEHARRELPRRRPSDLGFGRPDDSLLFGGLKPAHDSRRSPPIPTLLQGLALGVRGPGISGLAELARHRASSIPAFGVVLQALAHDRRHQRALDAAHPRDRQRSRPRSTSARTSRSRRTSVGSFPGAAGARGAARSARSAASAASASAARPRVRTSAPRSRSRRTSTSRTRCASSSTRRSARPAPPSGTLGVVPITKRTAHDAARRATISRPSSSAASCATSRRAPETKIPVLGDIPVLGVALPADARTRCEKRTCSSSSRRTSSASQADLRTIFERKMQERQEFLDRYFVFSDDHDYKPPKDYSRTNGLVEDIRQTYRAARRAGAARARSRARAT